MRRPDLLEFAKSIEDRLAHISRLLEAHEIENEHAQNEGYPTGPGFEDLTFARLDLLEAANDLQYVVLGRSEWLKVTLAVNKYDHLCYYMIDQFKIYRHVPLAGDISYAALGEACGLREDTLRRLLRHAMLNNLFEESRPGYVAHSEASALLVTQPEMASWLGHNYDEVFRSLSALSEAVQRYPATSDPGETACSIAFDQPRGFFPGLLQEQPWRAARFEEAMQAVTQGSHDKSHLVHGYDWAKHRGGLVVDVGGSSGFQSVAIAESFSDLRFVVQDIENHSSKLQGHILASRVTADMQFQVHNFFKPNPQRTADVYLLRHIIHDWGDEYAVQILNNIASVMKPEARILVVDIVVPEPGSLPWQAHRMISFMDLQMMVMVNGKERNKQEWAELLAKAHSKLRILGVTQPPHSVASIIEIGLANN